MKRMEVTEKKIGDYTFYIKPFPAFTAANISGDLAALAAPMIGALAPLMGNDTKTTGDAVSGIMDTDIEDALPVVTKAFSSLSGSQFERLMKKLLIDSENVSVEGEGVDGLKIMNYDIANEVFCGELQDMFILCFEVLKINFGGFFKKLGAQFGGLQGLTRKGTPMSENGESSIQASSQTSK